MKKSFSVALTYQRNEGAKISTLSKLHANVIATSEEEAIGLQVKSNSRLFENWQLCAVSCQEQILPEGEETTNIKIADKLRIIELLNLADAHFDLDGRGLTTEDLYSLKNLICDLKAKGF